MAISEHPVSSNNGRGSKNRDAAHRETQWPELSGRIAKSSRRRSLAVLWPEFSGASNSSTVNTGLTDVLCWGMDAGGLISSVTFASSIHLASQIASGKADANRLAKLFPETSLSNQIEAFLDRLSAGPLDISTLSEAVAWAYAMPNLARDFVNGANVAENLDAAETELAQPKKSSKAKTKKGQATADTGSVWTPDFADSVHQDLSVHQDRSVHQDLWWNLLGELQTISHSALDQLSSESPERLLAAGEIGAVLAWQLADLPSCHSMSDAALQAICAWFDGEGDSVAAALTNGGQKIRPVLASAIRSRRLAARMKQRIPLKRAAAAVDLATWVAATCRGDGSQTLGRLGAGKHDLGASGLLAVSASELGGPSLQTAIDATFGKTKSEGRLAWQVELPEPAWFDEDAGLAVMLPEWDVRRGRMTIAYKQPDRKIRFEISGGKHVMAAGVWGARLWNGDTELQPTTDWEDLCWHTDDDVHYLELEQTFEGNVKLQRQVLMIRDDRCLLLADAVIGQEGDELRFVSELPLANSVHVEEERDTRELLIVDGKVRALMMPLAMSEWKVGPTAGRIKIADQAVEGDSGQHLLIQAEVKLRQAVYSPLWLDFDRKRIREPRTWRQLTVGEKLRLTGAHEAAAYRVQTGDDQWVMYRSLNGQHNRTFLGKNLISEFFCGRFDAEDGSIEELVSVDEQND